MKRSRGRANGEKGEGFVEIVSETDAGCMQHVCTNSFDDEENWKSLIDSFGVIFLMSAKGEMRLLGKFEINVRVLKMECLEWFLV